jgi:small-conductance mechanosensitive channel
VIEIGARSTRLRTAGMGTGIVPNQKVIVENVRNSESRA